MFDSEYDVGSVVAVQARGQDFRFHVTPRFRTHYETEEFEAYTQRLVSRLVRRAATFVDVGAHYGFYSLLAAHHHPALRILACEPIPETAEVLARNIQEHRLAGVTIHRCAISSRSGRATMHRSLASDNCSFCPHPNAPPIGSEAVETRTIDSLLAEVEPGPLLLKIDTDGHEWEILTGMSETLQRFADLALIIELNPKMIRAAGHQPSDFLGRLDEFGLAVFLLDDTRRRAYRIDRNTDWTTLMNPSGYANLYCRPKPLALHVALFSHTADLGGAERSLLELARELIDDHWCLVSTVCAGNGPLVEKLAEVGAATLEADYHWWCGPTETGSAICQRLGHDLRALESQVTPVLRRLNPDVVWTQTLTIPWGALAARALCKPHVWSVCEYGDPEHDLVFPFARAELVRTIAQWSDHVFTATPSLLGDLFPDLPAERASDLYRHISIAQPVGSCGADLWRHAGATRLALLGGLQPGKGQKVALHAVKRLAGQGHAVELLLAGAANPASQHEIQTLIDELGVAQQVRYVGCLADPYPAIAAADIVLVCSRREGFCRVAVEAMLLGRAVVYANAGGPADFMIDGQTGLAYAPGDEQALAERIADLIADPVRRTAIGQRARRHAEQLFSADSYGGKVYRTLQRLRDQGPADRSTGLSLLAVLERAEAAALGAVSSELEAVRQHRDALQEAVRQHRDALQEALRLQVSQLPRGRRSGLLSLLLRGRTKATARAVQPGVFGARLSLLLCKLRLRLGTPASQWRSRWADLKTIVLSGLFDETFYRAVHPEREAGVVPVLDYLDRGGFQGRDPNPLFDSDWYLKQNPDAAAAGYNPLVHYIRHGAAERRNPHPCFDSSWYLENNPDVAAAGVEPLAHFLHHGWREGRSFGSRRSTSAMC
jgi:FkbM family methyltransferase